MWNCTMFFYLELSASFRNYVIGDEMDDENAAKDNDAVLSMPIKH